MENEIEEGKMEFLEDENKELRKQIDSYQKIIEFLTNDFCGNIRSALKTFDSLDYFEFIGMVDGNIIVKDNKIYIEVEFPEYDAWKKDNVMVKKTFEWYYSDSYAVWQTTDIIEDSYRGYMLLPTHEFKKFGNDIHVG